MIVFKNVKYASLRQLALAKKVNYSTFKGRIAKGWSISEALGEIIKPLVRKDFRPITVAGVHYPSIAKAAIHHGKSPDLCRDRIDLGWSIEKVFGSKAFSNKHPVDVKGKIYPSKRNAADSIGVPFTTFLNCVLDAKYISKPKDISVLSLIGTTQPLIYDRHVYPSAYLMLMSCNGVDKKQALRGSQAVSKQRLKNFPQQASISELVSTYELKKPIYLSELQNFISQLSSIIDLSDCFYNASDFLKERLHKAGFCRQKYLMYYKINEVFGVGEH